MKACGLIVEYNPFHNGHIYHLNSAKEESKADCMIAVMSGSFLQRGEPALIDKFHRTSAALKSGVDIVLELPYAYSVQSSDIFAEGAIKCLNALKIDSLCFGSESGKIDLFSDNYHLLKQKQLLYDIILKEELAKGHSYPLASNKAYTTIGFDIDMFKPNNILGFSYTKEVLSNELPINLLAIERINNNYHDKNIEDSIASATSVRETILNSGINNDVEMALPNETVKMLNSYKKKSKTYHYWEKYFNLLNYQVTSASREQLSNIALVDEGLHNRIKDTASQATSFEEWMHLIKTKRYTWTKIQRIFTHILTATSQAELNLFYEHNNKIRLLGMTETGQKYINQIKNNLDYEIITSLKSYGKDSLEAKISSIYYSIVDTNLKKILLKQEYAPPIIIKKANNSI